MLGISINKSGHVSGIVIFMKKLDYVPVAMDVYKSGAGPPDLMKVGINLRRRKFHNDMSMFLADNVPAGE